MGFSFYGFSLHSIMVSVVDILAKGIRWNIVKLHNFFIFCEVVGVD